MRTPLPRDQVLLVAILASLLFAILVSFSEELTYRGYCLQRLEPGLGRLAGVLLSSLIFALMHLPGLVTSQLSGWQTLTALCSLFLLAMALAIGFVRTGSTLWFPWASHFAHNLMFGFEGVLGLLFGVTLVMAVWWATRPRSAHSLS